MIVASRRLTSYERYFIKSLETCQLILEFESPKIVAEVVERFKKAVIGLHLKHDMENIYAIKGDVPVHQLPTTLETTKDCGKWCVEHLDPYMDGTLAAIACNDRRVAVNSSHCVADGGFLHYLFDHALDPNIGEAPILPISINEMFKQEIEQAKHTDNDWPYVCKLPTERKEEPSLVKGASYTNFQIPTSSLQAYDKNTGKVRSLTEYLWITLSLALSAHLNKFNGLGSSTCVDVRKLIQKPFHPLSTTNFFFCMNVIAKGATYDQTLGDFQKAFRKDFNEKLNSPFPFDVIKTDIKGGYPLESKPPEEGYVQITNVGPMTFKRPMTDFWVQQHMVCNAASSNLCMLSYSKVNESMNDVICRLRYSQTSFTEQTAEMLSDCVKYGIQNFPLSMPVREAFEEFKRFQSHYRRV